MNASTDPTDIFSSTATSIFVEVTGANTTFPTTTTLNTTTTAAGVHWTAVGIEITIIIIGALLTACCYCCCFRKYLGEDGASGGPNAIHMMQNSAYSKQQAALLAGGGGANQLRAEGPVTEEKHQRNMTLITKVMGEEKAKDLQETLKKNNLEIDPSMLDQGIKEGGPEVMKLMMKERLTMEEAIQKVAEQKAEEELAKAQAEGADGNAPEGVDSKVTSSDASPTPTPEL